MISSFVYSNNNYKFCNSLCIITLSITSVLAPLVNRISTASTLPLLTALNNGVLLF